MSIPKGSRVDINNTADSTDLLPVVAPQQVYPFRYMHHRKGWEFRTVDVAGKPTGMWMPVIKRFSLMPGVNGIRAGRGGAVNAKAVFQGKGWHFFALDVPVLSSDGKGKFVESTGYLQTFRTRNPAAPAYSDVWSLPYIVDSETVDWESHYDAKGYDATLLLWMELGLIKTPDYANVRTRIKVQGRRARRRHKLALGGTPAAVQARVTEDNKLEAMEAAAPETMRRSRPAAATSASANDDPLEDMRAILANQADI